MSPAPQCYLPHPLVQLVDADTENAFHATFIRQEKGGYLVSLYDGHVPLIQASRGGLGRKRKSSAGFPKSRTGVILVVFYAV